AANPSSYLIENDGMRKRAERAEPCRSGLSPQLGGHCFDSSEHAGPGMTALIFEELLIRRSYRDLVIKPKLGRAPERREVFHRGAKDPDMGRMRLSRALERREAFPPALSVGFLRGPSIRVEHAHIAIGVAADG